MPTSSSYYVTCGPNNLFNLDPMFRDTAAGDYSLLPCSPLINAGSNAAAAGILTDIAGSPRILEGTVDIGAYEAPAFALASPPQVGPACAGDANGSISVSPAFGCEPYAYQWLPAAGNGPELDGLSPGNYLLTLTDGSGRQILDTITVGIAPQPSVALAATDVPCGSTLGGTLSASVSSGTPPFHYTWNPAGADTSFLAQLSPLDYQLSVTDANGCLGTASASIGLQGLLTLMVDGALVSCHGASDGWLSATPVTGAAPFHWLWDGWPGTDSIAQPLAPGLYAVTVSDAYGCTAAFAFPPMTEPQALSATAGTEPQTDAAMPNGVAIVTTTSGGTMPYGYAWSTGEMGQFITGLEAGTYTVTVTDAHGCTASLEVTVELMVGTGGPALRALLIFPNPSADWAEIVLPENFPAHNLELTDASGRVVKALAVAPQTGAYRLNLSELPGGEYLVTLRGKQASELMTGKILKR